MSTRRRIVVWQPVLTDHLAYVLDALGKAADADMATIAITHTQAERVKQGWQPAAVDHLNPTILSRNKWVTQAVELLRHRPDTVHLFSGPFGDMRITGVLLAALAMRRKVYVISEPYSPSATGYLEDGNRHVARLKAKIRPLIYRFFGIALRRRMSGVFAISPLANQQFRDMGVPETAIFPFGYFVPSPDIAPAKAGQSDVSATGLKLCFVGSLILRKGLHGLIRAVRSVSAAGQAVSLDAYGAGDPSKYEFDDDTATYRGLIPFGTASAVMAGYHAVVVPSEHDGWGVVVNEALSAGVPVVVSKNVGASAMVEKFGCGIVYDPERPDALQVALTRLAAKPGELARLQSATRTLKPLLEPEVAGRYMADVMFGAVAPPCPWYDCP